MCLIQPLAQRFLNMYSYGNLCLGEILWKNSNKWNRWKLGCFGVRQGRNLAERLGLSSLDPKKIPWNPGTPWNTVWEPLHSDKELGKWEQELNQFSRLSNSDDKIAIFISTFHKHFIDELILGKGLAVLGTEYLISVSKIIMFYSNNDDCVYYH